MLSIIEPLSIPSPAIKRNKRTIPSPFTPDEDRKLLFLIEQSATFTGSNIKENNNDSNIDTSNINWKNISKEMGTRSVRQCKERYMHYLSPTITRNEWKSEEDALLLSLITEHGRKWKLFESFLKGRTEINIHNRFNVLSRRLNKIYQMKSTKAKTRKFPLNSGPDVIIDECESLTNDGITNDHEVNMNNPPFDLDIGQYIDIPSNSNAILYEMINDNHAINQLVTYHPNVVYYDSYYQFFVS